jgi:organic hydroperoxide reductase OsmC/OhrA
MVEIRHSYEVSTKWQGNRGTGTSDYKSYGREHLISVTGKPSIEGSADPAFRGNVERWNPEELLLAALSQCHMLSYLHVAASHGVVVTAYTDQASGVMEQTHDGGGHFISVTLRPNVTITTGARDSDGVQPALHAAGLHELAQDLHEEAARKCFIAASVNFPVEHEPTTIVEAGVLA